MEGSMDKPIFVLGIPRSGTSLVAGALQICGAWCGSTVPGGMENPRGFFEHITMREQIIKGILRQLDCDPLGVKKLPSQNSLPGIRNLAELVYNIIRQDGCTPNQYWVFKDAKLTLLWPMFHAAFPEARWVIVRRNKDDIVRSCLNTSFMVHHSDDPIFWNQWVDQYLERIDALRSSGARCWEIWPHDLIIKGTDTLMCMVRELDLVWREQEVLDFIDPAFWHGEK